MNNQPLLSGYGNVAPRTEWGKLATIVYAIAGMPLFLLYLSNIGDILAKSFKWIYAKCHRFQGCSTCITKYPKKYPNEGQVSITVPIVFLLLVEC